MDIATYIWIKILDVTIMKKLKLDHFKVAKLTNQKSIVGGTGIGDDDGTIIGPESPKCKKKSKVWQKDDD